MSSYAGRECCETQEEVERHLRDDTSGILLWSRLVINNLFKRKLGYGIWIRSACHDSFFLFYTANAYKNRL